tara:strand:- start:9689 stop:10606 length:918 start_codon:yes stop_codon:yes gene_type:complete
MFGGRTFYLLSLAVLFNGGLAYAQETSESAEVSMEDYSDTFQEKFFEALKQKGIENYDRAITLFMECKEMDRESSVLDHELAKAYMASGDHQMAENHAVAALNKEPSNLWYASTLLDIVDKKGGSFESVRAAVPYNDRELRENLATIYMERDDYESAQFVLNGVTLSAQGNILMFRIKEALAGKSEMEAPEKEAISNNGDPMSTYRKGIGELMEKGDFATVEMVSREAMELFPAQPFFYYVNGMALNKMVKHKEAAGILEEALDYLLDDDQELINNIHKELAIAYTGLGNSSKANMYLSKLKSGS